eukprot:TRINITY_DN122339_c0_g1_i1.p1 TRINITY_DN122339_c0_g1~~TRINITY_DN122339_c0_g1_i1.p1  ORF type:complete len:155 (-),score=4.10 TRINITY_DN122339_c0_g1_i1:71-535(-)
MLHGMEVLQTEGSAQYVRPSSRHLPSSYSLQLWLSMPLTDPEQHDLPQSIEAGRYKTSAPLLEPCGLKVRDPPPRTDQIHSSITLKQEARTAGIQREFRCAPSPRLATLAVARVFETDDWDCWPSWTILDICTTTITMPSAIHEADLGRHCGIC